MRFFSLLVTASALLCASCSDSADTDYSEVEQVIFDDWMAEHRPQLLGNYQSDGGYYIDLVSQGDTSLRAIGDTICWVEYDMTGYDLWGNVSITRSDVVAWQQGTFAPETHYVPYFRLVDEETAPILECTQLAFINDLTIEGYSEEVKLYNGAEFTLYSPSTITGSAGTTGTGGYEGQFSLSTLPFVCTIKVTNVVYDPLEYEEGKLDDFCTTNGGLTINPDSVKDEDDASASSTEELDTAWTNSVDTIAYLYINKRYTPAANAQPLEYKNPYISTVPDSPYANGVAELDKLINAALEERFSDDYDEEGEEVGDEGTADIWYICRFLDGFIVDTNIDEVKELIYGSAASTGSAISYDVTADEKSYISGWFYTIPYMNHGQWCAIAMTSTYAYGTNGVNGDTSTTTSSSSSSYYNYYNYYNNYNNYYGNSYYGYDYYNSNYYYNYNNSSSETTTTTTISTEILPYTPLLFQIYVEASDSE